MFPRLGLVGAVLLALGTTGCVHRITMAETAGDDGKRPHSRILYAGVRDGSRRYASYDALDASILDE